MKSFDELTYDAKGLIPVVVQEEATGEVLMLAWMNREAIDATLRTGKAHYFSRSRKRQWKKGESSGQEQDVVALLVDCDGDALLLKVHQHGVACHTGRRQCFFTETMDGENFRETMPPQISPETLYSAKPSSKKK